MAEWLKVPCVVSKSSKQMQRWLQVKKLNPTLNLVAFVCAVVIVSAAAVVTADLTLYLSPSGQDEHCLSDKKGWLIANHMLV